MRDGFTEKCSDGVPYLRADVLPCTHGFTTRLGGVSGGIYASLNLGEGTADERADIRENYQRLCAALGIPERLAFTRQVHGAQVRIVTERDLRRPCEDPPPPACDGLVTNRRQLPLIVFTADCIPVLLCEPEAGVIGAVHAGWRGTVADILGVAVEQMRALGARPENIHAAIGPGIGGECFETGPEVPEALEAWLPGGRERFCVPGPGGEGKFLVDLRGADRERLLRLGLRTEHIAVSEACTRCRPERFWSHRAVGRQRGNQAAVIMLD